MTNPHVLGETNVNTSEFPLDARGLTYNFNRLGQARREEGSRFDSSDGMGLQLGRYDTHVPSDKINFMTFFQVPAN